MYQAYWQLQEKPFENTPDPRFIYWSRQHEEALSRMIYVVRERKGAAMLTGEYGSGKTLLTRVLIKELSASEYQTALMLNPMLSPSQLIKEMIRQLGGTVAASASKAVTFDRLNELLVEINKSNKMAVVVVDEAQAIARAGSFEEFRLMLNFQLNEKYLVTLILIGQPELGKKIAKIPQFEQRIALRYHLKALSVAEAKDYVMHRLKTAKAERAIFTDDSFAEIYSYSQGIPRKINNLCDLALLVGYGDGVTVIDRELIKKVAADMRGEEFETLELEKEEKSIDTDS